MTHSLGRTRSHGPRSLSPPRWRPLPRAERISGLGLMAGSLGIVGMISVVPPAAAEVQLRCEGTLLEARGSADLERSTRRLGFSLGLEARAASADEVLGSLQARLAAVRQALRQLQVEELRVTSPTSWQRPAEPGRPAQVEAQLQVSGRLEPRQLQALIRTVGGLPGVRLAPVSAQADQAEDASVRRQLLRNAYRDALNQAREVAETIGRPLLEPLEVQLDGGELRPMAMRMAADAAVPPFDPAELPPPRSRLSLLVRFCAR
ncbi:MAG: SIMPL domain-containing protein [Synechococcaceae cyanobacterium]